MKAYHWVLLALAFAIPSYLWAKLFSAFVDDLWVLTPLIIALWWWLAGSRKHEGEV